MKCKNVDNAFSLEHYFFRHTALHRAVLSDSVGSARAFSGLADPTHLPNNQGLTPLMLAAMNGFDHTLKVSY